MTGIVKTDQIQGAQGTTVTVPTGNTLAVTGAMTTAAITSTGRHDVNFNGGATQAFKYTDTAGGNLASFGQFYNTSDALIGNVQNANNDGIHLNIKNGSIVFSNVGYTAANALDDYEEGTWTPTNTSSNHFHSTVTVTNANYTKIGRQVECNFQINMASSSGNVGSDSYFLLGGFPFTVNSTSMGTTYISTDPTSGGFAGGTILTVSGNTFAYVNFGSVVHGSIPRSNHVFSSFTYFTNQ